MHIRNNLNNRQYKIRIHLINLMVYSVIHVLRHLLYRNGFHFFIFLLNIINEGYTKNYTNEINVLLIKNKNFNNDVKVNLS